MPLELDVLQCKTRLRVIKSSALKRRSPKRQWMVRSDPRPYLLSLCFPSVAMAPEVLPSKPSRNGPTPLLRSCSQRKLVGYRLQECAAGWMKTPRCGSEVHAFPAEGHFIHSLFTLGEISTGRAGLPKAGAHIWTTSAPHWLCHPRQGLWLLWGFLCLWV